MVYINIPPTEARELEHAMIESFLAGAVEPNIAAGMDCLDLLPGKLTICIIACRNIVAGFGRTFGIFSHSGQPPGVWCEETAGPICPAIYLSSKYVR